MAQYTAESKELVGPVFDDSPFYFATERPWGMPTGIATRLFQWLLAPALGLLVLFAAFGKPSGQEVTPTGRRAVDTLPYHEDEIRRIAVVAFELARKRRKRVASVDKANALKNANTAGSFASSFAEAILNSASSG